MKAQQLLSRTEAFLDLLQVILVDEAATACMDQLQGIRGLRKIGRADLLIASIALARSAILVTRNVRHFRRVPGLTVVNWVD